MLAAMTSALAYKPSSREVVDRLRSLYNRQADDRIFATMAVPSQTLAEFRRRYPQPGMRLSRSR